MKFFIIVMLLRKYVIEDVNIVYLKSLEGVNERLEFVEVDILDFLSLLKVVGGCVGVFYIVCFVFLDIIDLEVNILFIWFML